MRRGLLLAGPQVLFVLCAGLSSLGFDLFFHLRIVAATLGVGLGTATARAWGERTRPRGGVAWPATTALLLAAGVLVGPDVGLPLVLGLLVAWWAHHGSPASPIVLLSSGVGLTLWRSAGTWGDGAGQSWAVMIAVLVALGAALLERDRLARPLGPVGILWWAVRMGYLLLWTSLAWSLQRGAAIDALLNVLGVAGAEEARYLLAALLIAALVFLGILLLPASHEAAEADAKH